MIPPSACRNWPPEHAANAAQTHRSYTTRWDTIGTTQALRHVVVFGEPRDQEATWRLGFWSADWTPWRALAAIAHNWPQLRFEGTTNSAPFSVSAHVTTSMSQPDVAVCFTSVVPPLCSQFCKLL